MISIQLGTSYVSAWNVRPSLEKSLLIKDGEDVKYRVIHVLTDFHFRCTYHLQPKGQPLPMILRQITCPRCNRTEERADSSDALCNSCWVPTILDQFRDLLYADAALMRAAERRPS